MRLTQAEFDALLARRATRLLKAPEVQLGEQMARTRPKDSKLEAEFAGHLNVMGMEYEREYRFHGERRWRFDFAFPAIKVAVELNGGIFLGQQGKEAGRHSRGAGLLKEYEKLNAAVELGWRVLVYGAPQVSNGEAALQVQRVVNAALAPPSSYTRSSRDP